VNIYLSVIPLNKTFMLLEALMSFGEISGSFIQGSIVDDVTQ
jgi:hypothetical protein